MAQDTETSDEYKPSICKFNYMWRYWTIYMNDAAAMILTTDRRIL